MSQAPPPSPRTAGLLLHPTSLPGRFGVGDLGPQADRFLDWAAAAGMKLWQVLPLGPAGPGESPYGALSAFAGNPLLVSIERLVADGLLPPRILEDAPAFPPDRFEPQAVRAWKEPLLRRAFDGLSAEGREAVAAFRAGPEQTGWLEDWALFAALSDRYRPAGWSHWPREIARRNPEALAAARRDLAPEIDYHAWVQQVFRTQWDRVREEGKRRGIAIVGDLPIYVSHHSADVWSRPELFALDTNGAPELVAGVPPDYFSATGQLWGYPLYRWDRLRAEGYAWWIARFRAALRDADLVRVDHFRGFASYWEVPASAKTAVGGRWVAGPGRELFQAVGSALGSLPFVAEDLGTITDDVRELLAATGIPGMRVLQFAFGEDDSPHAPHRHPVNAVVYTGTHDNDTARGWFEGASAEERARALAYLGGDGTHVAWELIRTAFESVAACAIVPVQDVFELSTEARMNVPARGAGNWLWRAKAEDFTEERASRLRRLVELTGRK